MAFVKYNMKKACEFIVLKSVEFFPPSLLINSTDINFTTKIRMKKRLFFLFLTLVLNCNFYVNAQQNIKFNEIFDQPNVDSSGYFLLGNQWGSIDFADIDNDSDNDLIVSGYIGGLIITKLLNNDGKGNFKIIKDTPFDGVYLGNVKFIDIDNDNDQDVFINGDAIFGEFITKLYLNDGKGNFTLKTQTPFEGVHQGDFGFIDIDNDNDKDLFISGLSKLNTPSTKLYLNNGMGDFSLLSPSIFDTLTLHFSCVAIADVDNDLDQDILASGENNLSVTQTQLYLNNGKGIFSLDSNNSIINVIARDLSFVDIENDGDQDVLISGTDNTYQDVTKLYKNSGSGFFTEVIGVPFDDYTSKFQFSDIDNDRDYDVLIVSEDSTGIRTKLYENNGYGNFTIVQNTSFPGVSYGAISFSDIDNDNDQDLLITGMEQMSLIAQFYRNQTSHSKMGSLKLNYISTDTYNSCKGKIELSPVDVNEKVRYFWEEEKITSNNFRNNLCPGLYSIYAIDENKNEAILKIPIIDSVNYFNDTLNFNKKLYDSVFINISNCNIDFNLPIDSIKYEETLVSSNNIDKFTFEYNLKIFQKSNLCIIKDTLFLSKDTTFYVSFALYCEHLKSVFKGKRINLVREKTPVSIKNDNRIYPNPFNESVSIYQNSTNEISEISIYDLTGKKIETFTNFQKPIINLPTQNISKGYFLFKILYKDNKIEIINLVKQ